MIEPTPATGEPDEEPTPEAPEAASDDDGRYRRRVAVVLALLAVLGAWINILHDDAATNESYHARETTRVAVDGMRANVNRATVEGLEVDLDAEREVLVLTGRLDAGDGLAGLDQEVNGLDRPELERALTLEAARLDLKRRALAETRVTYNNRASQYETVLTTLAVALFLVAFTLVLNRRTRPPILIPGLVLAAYVAGWAIWIHARDVPTTSDAAIEAVAEGQTAVSYGESEVAVAAFSRGIELDGDLVAGWSGRSLASFETVNPDFTNTLAVVTTDGRQVDQARRDAEEAIRLGQDQDFQGLLLSGLYRFYDQDYDGAVERLEEAGELNDRSPELFVLLAGAELARGDDEAAAAAFEAAAGVLDTDAASVQNRQIFAEALTLLEFIEHVDPDRAPSVDVARDLLVTRERELVTGRSDHEPLPDGAGVALDRLVLEGDEVVLDLSWTDLPASTDMSVYLYEQPATDGAFVQAAEMARFLTESGDGAIEGSVAIDRNCRPVALRLDVYLDGVLAESFDAPGGEATCGT